MATVTLQEGFSFDSIIGDAKQAANDVWSKTVGRAKEAAGREIDKRLPPADNTTGSSSTPPAQSESSTESSTTKTLMYVAGAAVIAFLIYKAVR